MENKHDQTSKVSQRIFHYLGEMEKQEKAGLLKKRKSS